MAYAVQDIIDWAKGSQPLALKGEIEKQQYRLGAFDLDLHVKIYVERKSLEWQFSQNPSASFIFQQANYVYSLCFPYILEAMNATGGGSVIVPGSGVGQGFPIAIDQTDFTSAVFYPNTHLAGINIRIFYNQINRYLVEGEWSVDTTGLTILVPGFDATQFDVQLVIEKVYPA